MVISLKTDTRRVLADFEGRWRVERSIRQTDGVEGRFEGEAVFAPDGAGALAYHEDGVLTMPGAAPMRATRAYRWVEGLEVFFDDGRPFHTVPATGGAATHLCPPDIYRVSYDFSRWPDWTATWDVTGPRKAYRMVSAYCPAVTTG